MCFDSSPHTILALDEINMINPESIASLILMRETEYYEYYSKG